MCFECVELPVTMFAFSQTRAKQFKRRILCKFIDVVDLQQNNDLPLLFGIENQTKNGVMLVIHALQW